MTQLINHGLCSIILIISLTLYISGGIVASKEVQDATANESILKETSNSLIEDIEGGIIRDKRQMSNADFEMHNIIKETPKLVEGIGAKERDKRKKEMEPGVKEEMEPGVKEAESSDSLKTDEDERLESNSGHKEREFIEKSEENSDAASFEGAGDKNKLEHQKDEDLSLDHESIEPHLSPIDQESIEPHLSPIDQESIEPHLSPIEIRRSKIVYNDIDRNTSHNHYSNGRKNGRTRTLGEDAPVGAVGVKPLPKPGIKTLYYRDCIKIDDCIIKDDESHELNCKSEAEMKPNKTSRGADEYEENDYSDIQFDVPAAPPSRKGSIGKPKSKKCVCKTSGHRVEVIANEIHCGLPRGKSCENGTECASTVCKNGKCQFKSYPEGLVLMKSFYKSGGDATAFSKLFTLIACTILPFVGIIYKY